jgi:hypothetical protein
MLVMSLLLYVFLPFRMAARGWARVSSVACCFYTMMLRPLGDWLKYGLSLSFPPYFIFFLLFLLLVVDWFVLVLPVFQWVKLIRGRWQNTQA